VDEDFRTCRHWRTYSIYRIEADDALTWYHSLSLFGRTRCRCARRLLPSQNSFVSAISDCATYLTVCLCRPSLPSVIAHRMRKQGVAYTGCKSEKPVKLPIHILRSINSTLSHTWKPKRR
jgi:hypothetical protein